MGNHQEGGPNCEVPFVDTPSSQGRSTLVVQGILVAHCSTHYSGCLEIREDMAAHGLAGVFMEGFLEGVNLNWDLKLWVQFRWQI